MSEDTVRDYVTGAYASREEDARAILAAYDAGEEYEGQDAGDALAEWPLSVEVELGRPAEVLLSWGGPGEWLEATCRGGAVDSVTFHVVWGSERQETAVPEDSPLFHLAAWYVQPLLDQAATRD